MVNLSRNKLVTDTMKQLQQQPLPDDYVTHEFSPTLR